MVTNITSTEAVFKGSWGSRMIAMQEPGRSTDPEEKQINLKMLKIALLSRQL